MKANGKLNGMADQAQFKMNHIDTLETDIEDFDIIGDNHIYSGIETPINPNAFEINDSDKLAIIERHFKEIMNTMGLDLNDDSLQGTPRRVAKMFVKEIFKGLNPKNKPAISLFENKFQYGQMLVERNIRVQSTCEHHFQPIIGKAHIAYISSGKVIGLSKINRIVDYYARRPQVQERMTVQIANELKKILETEDVAVIVDAKHFCVASRGIEDDSSTTLTAEYHGKFREEKTKEEFLKYISLNLNA
ncbi:MAG: GTP cyclohydrolase I FolE [Bacteroidetes bacterium]|nr:GTP cyclohydrolase I FolE [Bacteroidota bacterium]